MRIPRQVEESDPHRGLPNLFGAFQSRRRASLPAFLNGWMTVLLVASGAIAAVAMGFAGYLERFVPLDALGGRLGGAAVTIVLLSATNYVCLLYTSRCV